MSLLDDLKLDEGFRSEIYEDTKGNRTIGYGTNLEGGITKREAEFLLRNRVDLSVQEVDTAFPWIINLSDTRREVLYNMTYNMGITRLKTFKKMLGAAKAGDYEEAAAQILDSKAARDLPVRYTRLANRMK